jgi:hypothetical protein
MGEQPSLAPVPGLVYLMRPAGARDVTGTPAGPAGPGGAADGAVSPLPDADVLGRTVGDPGARDRLRGQIGRLLTAWLEAFDGRRPVSALRTGPFSDEAVERLHHQIRETYRSTRPRSPEPSRLLRVHLPPSHRSRPAFVGSALVQGRVRALAGYLRQQEGHWRIDDVTLL